MSAKGGAIREGQVEKQDGVLQSGRGHLGNPSMGSRLRSCRRGQEWLEVTLLCVEGMWLVNI